MGIIEKSLAVLCADLDHWIPSGANSTRRAIGSYLEAIRINAQVGLDKHASECDLSHNDQIKRTGDDAVFGG